MAAYCGAAEACMRRVLMALAAAGCLLGGAAAAQPARVPVVIDRTGDDTLGNQLTFAVRDLLGRSGAMREATADERSTMVAHLVTMDPDGQGDSTIYSLAISLHVGDDDFYYTSFVGVCGADRIASCGQSIYSSLGSLVEEIRQSISRRGGTRS
jgi:hypothetical protein